jgi:hypothetical protein
MDEPAQKLARWCARDEPGAEQKVNTLLAAAGVSVDDVHELARTNRAEELAKGYERHEPRATELVNELLDSAGLTIKSLMADAMAGKLDDIERIDRLATIAESRRNACLREIDRRQATLGEALRRSVQRKEDGEFVEVETPLPLGKSVA